MKRDFQPVEIIHSQQLQWRLLLDDLKRICRWIGLHPLVGAGMIVLDWMLFGSEAGSFGATIPISIVVGLLVILPCVLIQKYSYGDGWYAAIGKSMIVGILTGIPTALPSIGTGILTTLGLSKSFLNNRENDPDETEKAERIDPSRNEPN